MEYLLDTHFHLEFIEDIQHQIEFLEQISKQHVKIIAQTVTPTSFTKLLEASSKWRQAIQPVVSLGFHPWWIHSEQQVENELKVFKAVIHQTNFIGEIGLDFSPKRLIDAHQSLQIRAFSEIIKSIIKATRQYQQVYILSVHAVQSAAEVINILEELNAYHENMHVIMHRFAGTSDELTRHIRNGGYISIHPQMLKSKKGRAYVKQVPEDRVLIESDLPSSNPNASVMNALAEILIEDLTQTVTAISVLRQQPFLPIILKNQDRLYPNPFIKENI